MISDDEMMRWEAGDCGKDLRKAAQEIIRLQSENEKLGSESGRLRVKLESGADYSAVVGDFLRDSARS